MPLLLLFIAALWPLAGTEMTSLPLLVMFHVFLLLSHVVSWVRYVTIRQNSDVSVTSVTLTLPRLYEVG